MKTRHLLLLAGFLIAAWLVFFGDSSSESTPETELAIPVARSPQSSAASDTGATRATRPTSDKVASTPHAELQILALQPRADEGGRSGQAGDGLFSGKSWAPPPAKAKAEPPPVPTAPPLPFTYLGRQASGDHLEVYLTRGDKVIVVREKMVIDGTYRVESIKPPTVMLTYLPLNQIQQLFIGVID